jgi:hypothetical protein
MQAIAVASGSHILGNSCGEVMHCLNQVAAIDSDCAKGSGPKACPGVMIAKSRDSYTAAFKAAWQAVPGSAMLVADYLYTLLGNQIR